jgi:hypothetical protein
VFEISLSSIITSTSGYFFLINSITLLSPVFTIRNIIVFKEVQPSKGSSPKVSILFGKVIVFKEVQPAKERSAILVIFSSIYISLKEVQPIKEPFAILLSFNLYYIVFQAQPSLL